MNIKQALKNSFSYFFYFYGYLRHRVFIALTLSLFVGLLDGFGLAMFIPLLQMLDGSNAKGGGDLGNLDFIPQLMGTLGVEFNITSVLILILIFFTLKGVAQFIQGYVAVIYQQYFMREIRVTNIKLLNVFKFSEFVKADSGRIQNTFSGEVEKINMAFKSYLAVLQYASLISVYLILAFATNISFATMVTIGGAATNFIFKFLYSKTKEHSRKVTVEAHYFQGLLIQYVAFFKYLKATGLNLMFGKKLTDNINRIEYFQRKIGFLGSLLTGLREPLTILVVVVVILIQVRFLDAQLGTVILSLLFLYRALTFLMALQEHWNKFLAVSGSLENMTNFIEELKSGHETNGTIKFKEFKDRISLRDVSFSYGKTKILDSLNLTIHKNETVAIIGESGSGKSTLVNMLSGLLPPTAGEFVVDGIPLSQIDHYTFKNRIGYIAQEAPIFSDSVYNNVTFWAEKTPENYKNFIEALKKASIYDFVMRLPKKEEEELGNNGINVSGGQKQRLSIARELYKEVDFLFMDEATSALDAETEVAIQNNIDELKGAYTIVIIAHKLSTVKNADRIILMGKGRIKAEGSFQELLNNSKVFQNMIRLQGLETSIS
ncbi:ABC transporter ATP-binding protein [Pontibacter locisalis]|uniref:ABC transporter ATP-binding protein n=1 Tax=Pontibacter locisalis TaxID=1719035 RepID=A0ABW5IM95_9BACT